MCLDLQRLGDVPRSLVDSSACVLVPLLHLMSISPLQHSDDAPWHEHFASLPLAVLYKHSPTCGLSSIAMEEVKVFSQDRSDVPVFMVDVLLQRSLSNEIETRLRIRHESPQAIIFKHGAAVWHGSHRQVTLRRLSAELDS